MGHVATGLTAALEYHVVNSLGWGDLRPLQRDAVAPVRSGADCLLVAPTAGGKTEAAVFPLLSQMVEDGWRGLSVLYVTPLRALLNNLHPRVASYAAWLGRTAGLWHGDVGDAERRRMLADRPDILLTTPESLEAMLVSRRVDHRSWFSGVRAVVVDELHAFAGDDRGWHLLAVLERIERLAGRRVQRVGLSATVGNPAEMLRWLQGSRAPAAPASGGDTPGEGPTRAAGAVVVGEAGTSVTPEVTLDYVGSVENAAQVIALLRRGEKRLVFCESRRRAEELAYELRERGVTTFVSHSSLSRDERRVSEQAFAEARDCVIVATSTLELGVDIGDLDRVIQIDAPRSVASFLQRLGRTGRRPGSVRNTLFLALDGDAVLRAAGLLLLWGRGFVEPVVPPPSPRHIAAQQVLALALQEGRFGASTWRRWWGDLPVMADGEAVLEYLRSAGFLAEDGGMLFLGPAAEREFGRRNFMELLSAFTAPWELRVVAGTKEIGTVSPLAVALRDQPGADAARLLLLAGRSWRVEAIAWDKREVYVREVGAKGSVRWEGGALGESFEMCRAQRDVLLGADPPVTLSRRATARLATLREEEAPTVDADGLVLTPHGEGRRRLWTWAGLAANETLVEAMRAAVGASVDATCANAYVDLPAEVGVGEIRAADVAHALPDVTPDAVLGLKFSAALPREMATATLAERFADRAGAGAVVGATIVVRAPVSDLIRGGGGASGGSADRGPTVETSARPSPEPRTS